MNELLGYLKCKMKTLQILSEANTAIEKYAQALRAFTRYVYESEGLEAPENEQR